MEKVFRLNGGANESNSVNRTNDTKLKLHMAKRKQILYGFLFLNFEIKNHQRQISVDVLVLINILCLTKKIKRCLS